MSPSPKHWWAGSARSARRTAVGGSALLASLLVVSAMVWAAPGGGDAPPLTTDQQLAAALTENERLKAALDEAEQRESTPLPSTPSPSPSPSKVSPTPTPTAAPDNGQDSDAAPRDTLIVIRTVEVPVEVQPHPVAPEPAPQPTPSSSPTPTPRPSASSPAPTPSATVTPSPTPTSRPTPTPSPTPTPVLPAAPTKAELVSPDSRYFGMYTVQAPFNFATFDDVAFKLGVRQSLVGYFSGWDKPFRADAVTRSWQRGLMPVLTWESRPSDAANDVSVEPDYTLAKIIGGDFDDYIRTFARDIVATGLPMGIRLNHEMNGSWYPWSEMRGNGQSLNTNSRGEFVEMWRHVHDIFEDEGANELVVWVWAPNIVNNLADVLKDPAYLPTLYPGDEYVDWMGLSGYLRPTSIQANRSFTYTFGDSLDQIRAIADKPIFLSEIGATEIGGRKAEWVTSLFEALTQPANDDIVGIGWFNITVTTISNGERVTNDWRVDSRADSLAAFRNGITDPATGFDLRPY